MCKRNETANFNIPQMFIDIVLIFISYCGACLFHDIFHGKTGLSVFNEHFWFFPLSSVIFILSMHLMRMYNVTTFYYLDRLIKRVIVSTAITGMSIIMIDFMMKNDGTSRLLFSAFCILSCMLVIMSRVTARTLKKNHIGNGYKRVVFIGDDHVISKYNQYINKTVLKIKIMGKISYNDPVLNSPDEFARMLMDLSINEVNVIIPLDGKNHGIDLQALLMICENMGITAKVILDSYDSTLSKRFTSSVGTYPVITYHSVSFNKLHIFVKQIFDVTAAAIGLLLLSPVFIMTAIAIKLDSPGPVFFKQKRVGTNGEIFYIYKFRSMFIDAEERKKDLAAMNKIKDGMMFKIDNDPRITRVGSIIRKTSIDELPQLLNVLKHDMSLVGTRPPTLDEVQKYSPEHWRRISILPGITGMWQVNGRSQILNFEDIVKLDKEYIDNWSFGLDILLLLKTVKVVFTTKGAA